MVIRVLSEVKFREDEYDVVKDISSRIQGLPPCTQLAKRERRLLTQGTLHYTTAQILTEPNSVTRLDTVSNGTSRLTTAINSLSPQHGRPELVQSRNTMANSYEKPSQREKSRASPSRKPSTQELSLKMAVHVFVFNDLIILTTPIPKRASNRCQNWRLLDDIGIARILTVTQNSDELSGVSALL